MKEFYRMSDFFAWGKNSSEKKKGLQGVRDAIAETFNDIYGTNVKCLRSWHNLCRAVYIDPLPQDIHSCRKVCFSLDHRMLLVSWCWNVYAMIIG